MILVLSLTVGVLFGAGAYLLLKPDLLRVIVGVVLISHAANLALMGSGLARGKPPIYPLPFGETISDPLVQALIVTSSACTSSPSRIARALSASSSPSRITDSSGSCGS